jgi:hypothetical protein
MMSARQTHMHTRGDTNSSENYAKAIDAIDLMDHLIDEKIYTVEEERDFISKNEDPQKRNFIGGRPGNIDEEGSKQVYFEEVKFKRDDKKTAASFREFEDKTMQILSAKYDKAISRITGAYIKFSLSPDELFREFLAIFGPVLVYKYVYLYSRTVKNESLVNKLYAHLLKELSRLRYQNNNVLSQVYTWKDFFHKISDELAANLFNRIDAGKLDLTKNYRISSARMFQLFGSIKTLTLKEFGKFKYLNNFLQNPEAKAILQRFLFVPFNKSQSMIDKISNIDMLIMFIYFNLSCTKFEYNLGSYDGKKINPNLLKVFMKHYINYSKEKKYDIVTDDEDFKEIEGVGHQEAGNRNNIASIYRLNKPQNSQYHKKPVEEKRQVFAEDLSAPLGVEFDFPELPNMQKTASNRQKEKGKTNKMPSTTGWGGDQTLLYSNEQTKRKAMKEEFPELKPEDTKGGILNKMNDNKKQDFGWGKQFNYNEQQSVNSGPSKNIQKPLAYIPPKSESRVNIPSNDNEFPTLDQDDDINDIFAKMKKSKMHHPATKTIIKKGPKPAPQQDTYKQVPRKIKNQYFDQEYSEEEEELPVAKPEPPVIKVPIHQKKFKQNEFPEMRLDKKEDEDIFKKMQVSKKNVIDVLSNKFGYGVSDSKPQNGTGGRNIIDELSRTNSGKTDVIFVNKKKKK